MRPLHQVPGPYEDTTCQMVVAYGEADHAHLETIRTFRDTVLDELPGGGRFISLYYATAPICKRLAAMNRVTRIMTLLFIALPAYSIASATLALTPGR